jgi:hypothetical protein
MPKIRLSRDRAWACVMQNVTLPGWGSLKAGKKFTGMGEMFFALAGLFFLFAWMVKWIIRIFQSELDEDLSPIPSATLWQAGVVCVVISWIWTMATCISLMRQARADEAEIRKNPPPHLSDLDKPPKL